MLCPIFRERIQELFGIARDYLILLFIYLKSVCFLLPSQNAYASDIRTASRFTSEHLAEVDSYALPICFRTF